MKHSLNLILVAIMAATGGCTANPAGPGVSPLHGVVFVNEFMASNDSVIADEYGDYDDWIELYNAGDTDVDLGVVYLTDDLSIPTKWMFTDTVLPAQGYMLVWADGEYDEGWLHTSFKLNANPGEQLGLYSTDGERVLLVDSLSFGPQQSDVSYGRLPDGGDDWELMSNPSPGAENRSDRSELRGTLFINEVMASNGSIIPDEQGDFDDWVELYNAGTTAVSLAGLYLTDDRRSPAKWRFPDTSIAAGEFLLVWADGEFEEGPLHAGFNLGALTGEEVGLFAVDSPYVGIVDTMSFGPQSSDTSYGRAPDGAADWFLMSEPTPGGSNALPPGPDGGDAAEPAGEELD